MALGDGDGWDETVPVNATIATQIDDYDRDLRKGVRSRMALEHEWPASQSATSEAGAHKFITLQNQATVPSAIAGTQIAAYYSKTVGSGLSEAFFADELKAETQLTSRGALKQLGIIQLGLGQILTGTTAITADATFRVVDDTEGKGKVTMTTGARRCLILAQIYFNGSLSAQVNSMEVLVDDAVSGGSPGLDSGRQASSSEGGTRRAMFVTAVLTAAEHTFKLRYRSDSGGGTLDHAKVPALLQVFELAL